MRVNRRELFKAGGCVLGAMGISQLPVLKTWAAGAAPDVDVYAF